MNTLEVYFRDSHCARLMQKDNGDLQFQYLEAWLEHGRVTVSLTLPLKKEVYNNYETDQLCANLMP